MAYEFDKPDADLQGRIPKLPDFWGEGRVFSLLPMDMGFVSYGTVVVDSDRSKRHIGIDTKDYLPHPDNIRFTNTNQSMGIVRLLLAEPVTVDGFIIDLRYATRFPTRRGLEFHTPQVPQQELEDEDDLMTVPPLGAIFVNPETGRLLFSCEHEEELRPFAADLATYVDEERKRRGGTVIGDKPDELTEQPSPKDVTHEA